MTTPAELTLESALSDPLILTLMRADRVDPEEMRVVWTEFGAALRADAEVDSAAPERIHPDAAAAVTAPRGLRGLITDCLCAGAARTSAQSRQTNMGSR